MTRLVRLRVNASASSHSRPRDGRLWRAGLVLGSSRWGALV